MEPAQIDWKQIDSRFVEDVFYEHIRAPKWFDFLAPNHLDTIDDDAWFCKPDCNHPKRPEDFLLTPNSSKHPSLRDTNEAQGVTEQNQRRKGHASSPSTSNNQETENQNPNLATPPSYQEKSWRGAIKSSSVKKMNKEMPRLKSTQSARNLFSGRDILGHISEFCYELKRLATRVTEREDTEKSQVKESHHQLGGIINQPYSVHDLELKKERKPLLEVSKDKLNESTDVKGTTIKENRRRKKRVDDAENIPVSINVELVKNKGEEGRRKKRLDDAENIPVPVPLKLENAKNKAQERLLQIRTNPPSPQCFSDNRKASLKPLRTKPTEMVKRKEDEAEEEKTRKSGEGKEGRGLDVLWFLKPCTLAN
ncbi:hypothetical protein V5N11_013095 [Cardamine amara subsp. amara]|uniref:Interferon-activable protein n=1 Tax=Cardamine amara subsp. amara TaxID=228776 RepID=A0ABD0ZZS5_CARAN